MSIYHIMDISAIIIHVNYDNCKCCRHAMASSNVNSEKYYNHSEKMVCMQLRFMSTMTTANVNSEKYYSNVEFIVVTSSILSNHVSITH
jgi:hypothetical protein